MLAYWYAQTIAVGGQQSYAVESDTNWLLLYRSTGIIQVQFDQGIKTYVRPGMKISLAKTFKLVTFYNAALYPAIIDIATGGDGEALEDKFRDTMPVYQTAFADVSCGAGAVTTLNTVTDSQSALTVTNNGAAAVRIAQNASSTHGVFLQPNAAPLRLLGPIAWQVYNPSGSSVPIQLLQEGF